MVVDGWKALETQRRREAQQEKLEAYVKKVVDEAPPLTDEQRDRIAAILRATAREAKPR